MLYSEIKELGVLASSDDPDTLAQAIADAVESTGADYEKVTVGYYCPIQSAPMSCRLFSKIELGDTISLPGKPWTALDLGYELVEKLVDEARYPSNDGLAKVKGWEVHKVSVRGHIAALVCAAWVQSSKLL